MNSFLPPWLMMLLPPVLGAVIGYVTNAIAIRMLFRPLERKFFLGVPLPLTPGIIPRQRESLAHSIARMVSKSLFNVEVINSHLSGEGFQSSLKRQLRMLLSPVPLTGEDESLQADAAGSVMPVGSDAEKSGPIRRIGGLEAFLIPAIESPLTRQFSLKLMLRLARLASDRRIDDFLPTGIKDREGLSRFFRTQLEGRGWRKLRFAAVRWVRKKEQENVSLSRFFSRAQLRRVIHVLDRFYVPGINFILGFLRRPDIRRELVRRGKSILSDIILKLSPVQRIMLSAGQYDRTLEENMPGIISDLTRSLEETLRAAENREKILAAVHEFISGMQETGIADLEERYHISLSRTLHRGLSRLAVMLLEEDAPRMLADFILERTGQMSQTNAMTLESAVRQYTGMEIEALVQRLHSGLFSWLEDEQKRNRLFDAIGSMVQESLKSASGPVDTQHPDAGEEFHEDDDRLVNAIGESLTRVVQNAVPALMDTLNIYQMVVDRINSLDILEVEQLLLGIMARHLKYINIFGAFLGALIGGLQLLLGLFS